MLQDFLAEIQKDGYVLSKPYLFLVAFGGGFDGRKTALLCHTATLPFWTVHTVPNRIYGYTVEMPADISFNTVNFSFYVDSKWNIVKVFDEMKANMFNEINYSPKYYDDYTFTVDITILDNSNTEASVAQYKLHDCVLRNYQVQGLSWASVNTVQNVNVELSYSTFDTTFDSTSMGLQTPTALSTMNRLISAPESLADEIGSSLNFDTVKQISPDIAQYFNLGSEIPPPISEGQATEIATELRDTVAASFPRIIG